MTNNNGGAPRKQVMWIKHDTDAHGDLDLVQIVLDHGAAGYGIWWMLLELMGSKPQHGYRLRVGDDGDRMSQRLGALLRVDQTLLRAVVNDCLGLGLMVYEGEWLWSPGLVERMQERDRLASQCREASAAWGREGARRRWGPPGPDNREAIGTPIGPNGDPIGTPIGLMLEGSRVEGSRVEMSRVEVRARDYNNLEATKPALSTDPDNPDPLHHDTRQPMPWDPWDPFPAKGMHPIPHLPGYWHRRYLRALKERSALRSPMSFDERGAAEAEASKWDEDSEFQESNRAADAARARETQPLAAPAPPAVA